MMSGPGDRAFHRWAKRFVSPHDAELIRVAYKKARLITVDNRAGTFEILDPAACHREALEAAAENLHPARSKKWNRLNDAERSGLVESLRTTPEQWEKQERVDLARAKLEAKRRCKP